MTAPFFELCVHPSGDRVATGEGGARTAGQLLSDAGCVADALGGFPAGSQVAVVCHDRYLFTVALLAAASRGLVVALPPNAQPETVKQLRATHVRTVITDQDGTPGIDVRMLVDREGPMLPRPELAAEQPFVVVYTSGSTGTPLACHKSASQLLSEAQVLAQTFGIGASDTVVATVPPHHIYGLLFSVLVPLVSGASFCRETPFYADVVHRVLTRDAATTLVSVPAHLRALSIMDVEGSGGVRRVFSSGAALPDSTRVMIDERFGWKVTEILGSSETGGIGWRDAVGAPFVAFAGIEVAVGAEERMLVRSPYLPADAPSPLQTGDRIELLAPGVFRHLGRADGVLKIGGTRVSVLELEARLTSIAGVREAAVLTIEGRGGRGHETWAVLACGSDCDLDAEQVRTALRAWLDPVVIPRRFRFVRALPREATGKLKKDVLRALFEEGET